MRLIAVLMLCFPLSANAQSSPATFDSSLIDLSYGVYCAVYTEGSKEAPGTAAGEIGLYTEVPNFEWLTNIVPAVPGMSFAVKTTVIGPQSLDPVIITLTHPPFEGLGTERQTYITSFDISGENINAYTFDLPYELETGEWVFEATYDGKQVYRVAFKVVDPALAPEIAGGCGGDIIS